MPSRALLIPLPQPCNPGGGPGSVLGLDAKKPGVNLTAALVSPKNRGPWRQGEHLSRSWRPCRGDGAGEGQQDKALSSLSRSVPHFSGFMSCLGILWCRVSPTPVLSETHTGGRPESPLRTRIGESPVAQLTGCWCHRYPGWRVLPRTPQGFFCLITQIWKTSAGSLS